MQGATPILLTILIVIGINIFFFNWLQKRKKKHLLTIESDWKNFKKAIVNNHIEGVSKFGTAVIWNEHFNSIKLKEMSELIHNLEQQNPEFKNSSELKKLKSIIYNKYLDWNIKRPYIG